MGMKRKFIKQDAFDQILSESVTTAEHELVEAAGILARATGKSALSLVSFTESKVVYKGTDGTYVHAGYAMKNGNIEFNGIEELVIDEASAKQKRRATISEMLDAAVSGNAEKAKEQFKAYLEGVRFGESHCDEKKKFPFAKKGENPFAKKGKDDEKSDDEKQGFFGKAKKAGKDIAEAYATAQEVLSYVKIMRDGPALVEAAKKVDDRGNLTDIRIPGERLRNENRIERSSWKTLNAKVADGRRRLPELVESSDFCKAVAHLKRQNSFSDVEGVNEALEYIVRTYPDVLYVTKSELAEVIAEALQNLDVRNFDDTTCEFMAEGILATAHGAFPERVKQILHLAGVSKVEEGAEFATFQGVVESFYPALDEKFGLERQAFVDLYRSLGAVYSKADRTGNQALKNEAAAYLNDLSAVLNGEVRADLELAEEAAQYLATVIESNLEGGEWVVSNKPHFTVNGDHPDMESKARHSYTPSKDFSGNWGDPAPAIGIDDNNYKSGRKAKEMRNKSWGQEGGSDVWPSLTNKYMPKHSDFTMKGEKGVDKDNSDHSLWTSPNTWPNVDNPYMPKEVGGPGGTGYKMKNGKGTDLVVDR